MGLTLIDQIGNEMAIASHLMKTNNVSRIAGDIGYRPILIISALHRAGDSGKFTYDKKKDIIKLSEDLELKKLSVTEGMRELIDILEEFMGYLSRDETDMTIEELMMMLGGTPEIHIKIAAFVSDKLATYEFQSPDDKKTTYTFVTLKENLDKQWGSKQFDKTKSKASKLAKK